MPRKFDTLKFVISFHNSKNFSLTFPDAVKLVCHCHASCWWLIIQHWTHHPVLLQLIWKPSGKCGDAIQPSLASLLEQGLLVCLKKLLQMINMVIKKYFNLFISWMQRCFDCTCNYNSKSRTPTSRWKQLKLVSFWWVVEMGLDPTRHQPELTFDPQ